MSTVKKLLLGLEQKYKICAVLAPVAIMGEVLLEVFIPFIMAKIIDVGIAEQDAAYVIKTGSLMIGAALFSLIFGVIAGRFAAVSALGFARNLRRRLFAKIQEFSFSNIDKFSTSSLVTRLTSDVTNSQNTFQMIIRMCVRSPFMFISAIVMAFYMNSELALIFVVCIPLIAVPMIFIMKTAHPRFQVLMKNYDNLNAKVQENLIGIRAVKAFVREENEKTKFNDAAEAIRNAQVRAEKIVILSMPLMILVIYIALIALLWFGGNFIIAGKMQTGELISFITYMVQILSSLMMLSMIFIMIVISKASIGRIIEVFDEEPDVKDSVDSALSADKAPADGSVEFRNVSFSYDKTEKNAVLHDISFLIKSGETIGIIGGTGSSKSTIVQLILRLYDTLCGSVLVGGNDVKSYKLEKLRENIAIVLQKNVLFSGTILENLRWGNKNASTEQIENACRTACAHDFIISFPKGYETELGQGGVNLSGGQKQRLCIARALLKEPKVLILDDSTSAVDTATDAAIRNGLKNTLPETTKIIIAQRIASVKDADRIFVIDEGRISSIGTHDELIKSNKIYREVFESQQKGSDFDGAGDSAAKEAAASKKEAL
ncbi:MAG: ABC transporter ATP-binding protein [Treponema sp.]|jgi:ATP-binding cassette subfamily B protein|nr:ABC transporter ATP-binding protein [Treponema sp.]